MGVDIGPKISIEGEKQFKESIRAINSQIKANDAELKKLSVEYDKNNSAVDNLSRRQKVLNDSLNANQQKVKALSAEYDRQKTKLSGLETALETARKENGENSREAAAAETAYTRQAEAVNKLESQISYTSGQISKLSTEIKNNSTQLMEARSHAIKYGESMSEAGEKITAAGDKVSKAGTALTVGVTTPLVAAGVAMIKCASDTEESENKVRESFKDAAKQVEDFAKTTVENYGISRGAALDMAALFGDMGTSMGLPRKTAAEMSTTLVGLAGDLASFKNIELDAAQTALKGIFTGETESLKNLGVVMTETNLQAWAMENGLIGVEESWKNLSQTDKVMLRYKYVIEQTSNAHGDYARTADGTANSIRTMQESAKEAAAEFGAELLPAVTPIIKKGTELIHTIGSLDSSQKQLILRAAGIAVAAGPVLKIVGTSVSGVGKLTSGIGGLVKDLGKISAAKKSAQALELVGVEAKGSTESVSGLSTTLAKLASPAGVAVVAAGALIGVGAAVLKIRDDAIKADIEKHFGNIRLSAEEVEDVAKRLTTSDWKMKVSAALDAKKDLEQMEANMKSAMETINKTEWKVSVGLSLTEEEKSSYLSSVESFTKSASDYITQQGYTISLALDATIGNDSKTGAGLSAFVNSYMASAQGELEELGKQLADKVNKSFENGTFAEDQVDIQKIYDQMNAILQEISDAEYEAKMDGMKIKYSAEGFGIDKDSFDRLNEEMGKDFEETVENLMEAQETALTGAKMQYKAMIKEGISEEFAGSVYQDTYNAIKADTLEKVGDAAGVGFKYAFDTITNNYKEEVEKSKQGVSQYTDDYLNSIKGQIEDGTFLWEKAITQFEQDVPALEGSAKRTVQDMVESLKPQKETLQGLANECIAAGQSVPESVQQGLNDIAKWEAMAGSASGMYTLLAQELAENPGKFAALRETAEFGENIPQELADAIAIHTGYVYNATTGLWEQVKSGSEMSAEEAAAMLNKCGETLGEELCKSLQNQYGLIYQNGQYMIDQAAKGAEDNKSTFIKVSTSVAAAGVGGMRTLIKNTTLDPPNMSQPDWTPQARNALADMQEVVSGITFTANLVLNATAGIIHPHADGGIVTRPEIGLVGEDGPEAIIPLSKSRRSEAMSLLSAVEGVMGYDPFAYSASAARSMSASYRQSERTPAPAETKPTYQIGDIKVEIHTETDDPDRLYREFTTRLNRDVGRAIRSSRG